MCTARSSISARGTERVRRPVADLGGPAGQLLGHEQGALGEVEPAHPRTRLRQIAREGPRWGWKTAYSILRREGWAISRKRIQRLWREEGLKRRKFCRKRRRLGPL